MHFALDVNGTIFITRCIMFMSKLYSLCQHHKLLFAFHIFETWINFFTFCCLALLASEFAIDIQPVTLEFYLEPSR